MKWQTTIGKAFEINKNASIYGAFAEIGAGQETVNVFYKAGMASQTVAKSMSAYDMTVSDEIYGKQSRYVCKDRLFTMLNHEYPLLEKRLKKKIGKKTCFFVFATTAVTSTRKKDTLLSSNQHAWMGLRFQAKPLQTLNDIIFHVNCLDKNRLQQHEALGILGVNLIYACFHYKDNPKRFISSLTENLSGTRIEIHGMTCSGTAFKKFSPPLVNLEILSQNLSPLAYFPEVEKSEYLSDATFEKSLVILYGDKNLTKSFKEKKISFLNSLSLSEQMSACISFAPKEQFNKKSSIQSYLKELCKNNLSVLIAPDLPLEELKKLLSLYTHKALTFVVSEEYFTKKMFDSHFYKNCSLLKSLGLLFDQKTKVAVFSKDKNFSVQNQKLKSNQEHILKNYLVAKKQILDIKF